MMLEVGKMSKADLAQLTAQRATDEYIIAYLGIVSTSGFSNSERFLLPGLPCLLIMAAYGVTLLNAKNYKFIKIWYWVVPVMAFAWAFFKLGSRGLF